MSAPIESTPPPRAPAAVNVPTWARVVGLAVTLLPNVVLLFVVPKFAAVFHEFGTALPALARLCIAAPWAGLLWSGIVAFDGWRPRQRDGTLGFLLRAVLGSLLLFGLVWFSMSQALSHIAGTI